MAHRNVQGAQIDWQVNAQTGTTYTVLDSDRGKLITINQASSIAVTLPQAGAAGSFLAGWFCEVFNYGAGVATITPATSTIVGGTSFILNTGQSVRIFSDGTNYQVGTGGFTSFGVNKVLASPGSGGTPGTPSFRALVGADLPAPSSSTLGGTQSIAAVATKWINTISTSGVPALTQPAFTDISGSATVAQHPIVPQVRVYNSGAISVANTALTAMTFDSERWDTDTMHSTSSNTSRLTATTKGLYSITGNLSYAASVVGGQRYCAIRLNGATYVGIQINPATTAGVDVVVCTVVYQLNATDYVELIAYQDSGGALNVNAAGNYSPEFSMTWLSNF